MALLEFTKHGIYCRQADLYIDPLRKVERALITHGHSDHARPGHTSYLSSEPSVAILKHRLGKIKIDSLPYGKEVTINGVHISFHPAGHVIGSAQIRLEYKGEIWVASGDYKVEDDGISEPFEPVKCHHFITETTFALPVYQWKPQASVMAEIDQWWHANKENGHISLISAYSLGKAQRLIANLDHDIGRIYCDGPVDKMNKALRQAGIALRATYSIHSDTTGSEMQGGMVIGSASGIGSTWRKINKSVVSASASGWNQLRSRRVRSSQNRGFILSDHADWKGLNDAIRATGAETIHVTHGYTKVFKRWLEEEGYQANVVPTKFIDEKESLI